MMPPQWSFALPPSTGDTHAKAAAVRTCLSVIGCSSVHTALTYGGLIHELLGGAVDAAWAPPLVCARVAAQGGSIILQSVRGGAASYRSVLFVRADSGLTLDGLRGTTAGWLDEQAMSGYVLPRAFLRAQGLNPDDTFRRQRFLGSYNACVEAVLERKVHVSASYASAAGSASPRDGFQHMAGARAQELAVLAYTPECPNDGIVLSPRWSSQDAQELRDVFLRLLTQGPAARVLSQALEVDSFAPPSVSSYVALQALQGESA